MRIKVLSFLPLLIVSCAAALSYSGELRYDTHLNLHQQAADGQSAPESRLTPNIMSLSRLRFDLKGEPLAFWSYHIRLQKTEQEASQLDLDLLGPTTTRAGSEFLPAKTLLETAVFPLEISQAYMSYKELDAITLSLGLIPLPQVSCNEIGSSALIGQGPGNVQIGTIVRDSGQAPGLKVQGHVSGWRYHFAVWKQSSQETLKTVPYPYNRTIPDRSDPHITYALPGATSLLTAQENLLESDSGILASDFTGRTIKWAYGGRVNWVQELPYNVSCSAALGYNHVPLSVPIVAAVFGGFDNLIANPEAPEELQVQDLDAPNYFMASYDYLTSATFDFNWASTIMHTQFGYQYQKMHINSQQHYYTSMDVLALDEENAASEAFQATPKTSACWAQWGTMLFGGRYQFDHQKGVISGVSVRQGGEAFEFVLRGGMVLRKNIMALLHQTGFDDYATADRAEPLALASPRLDLASLVVFNEKQRYLLLLLNNSGKVERDVPYDDVSVVLPNDRGIAFQSRCLAWSAGVNYYPYDAIAFKLTYTAEHYQFKKETSYSWVDSLFMKNRQTLSFRCETSF